MELTKDELFDLRGMGVKLVVEIRERLAEDGLVIRGDPPIASKDGE